MHLSHNTIRDRRYRLSEKHFLGSLTCPELLFRHICFVKFHDCLRWHEGIGKGQKANPRSIPSKTKVGAVLAFLDVVAMVEKCYIYIYIYYIENRDA